MKTILLILSLVFSLSSWAAITVVSDLDDTIKITNSGKEVDGAINALFSNEVFTGIPEFFLGLRNYVNEVHVLSASPTILRPKINLTLKKKKIRVDSLILRNLLHGEDKFSYKLRHLTKLMEDKSGDDFIFLGDDVGADPEVYDELRKLYPNRVLAIYIHVINGRPLPKSSIKYWTTYDLFLREYMAGRMSVAWVDEGAKRVLEEQKMKLIFPSFAACPRTPEIWLWQLRSIFALEAVSVMKKLNLYCFTRLPI